LGAAYKVTLFDTLAITTFTDICCGESTTSGDWTVTYSV
jgi:hypothetical protein